MSERRRVWGLFCLYDQTWECREPYTGSKWQKKPKHRTNFNTLKEAVERLEDGGYIRAVHPRPFYIVSKPKLPDDVKELIAAARVDVGRVENFDAKDGWAETYIRYVRAVRALDGKY